MPKTKPTQNKTKPTQKQKVDKEALIKQLTWLEKYKAQLKAQKGLENLYFFNREILEEGRKKRQKNVVPHVHGEWWKWYKRSRKSLKLILVPRNTLKSTFFTVGYPLQRIAKDPNVRILIANAKLDNAIKFLAEIKRNIKENEGYIENYGELHGPDLKWSETEIEIVGRDPRVREPTVMTAGVGQGLAGMHFDVIIGDDLVNETNSTTREQAQKVIDWWRRSISLLDPKTGEVLTIGTRWSHFDLYQYIQEQYQDQVDILLKTAYNEDGSAYYPELLSLEKLEEIKSLEKSYTFCNPHEAPVLMADWRCKPISKIESGETVVGWKIKGDTGRRILCPSKIISTHQRSAQVVKIRLESGRTIRCTLNHRWFTKRGTQDLFHQEYAPAKIDSKLMYICDPYLQDKVLTSKQERLARWLGGLYDGDGSFSGMSLFYAQDEAVNPEVCRRMEEALNILGFNWGSGIRKPKFDKRLNHISHEMKTYWIKGGFEEKRRFLIQCDPAKKEKISQKMFKHSTRFVKEKDRVVDIQPDGKEIVFSLQTETGNYIAWGYGSSNSAFYLNDPVDVESVLVQPENLHHIGNCDCGKHHRMPPRKQMTIFSACDPKASISQMTDQAAIITVGIDSRANMWVLNAAHGNWSMNEMIERLFKEDREFNPELISIEVVGQAQLLTQRIREVEIQKNKFLPIKEIPSRYNIKKEVRIKASLQDRFQRNKVFLAPHMQDLEDQCLRYPRSKHDDLLDCLSDIAEICYTPAGEIEEESKEPVSLVERVMVQQESLKNPEFTDPILGEMF